MFQIDFKFSHQIRSATSHRLNESWIQEGKYQLQQLYQFYFKINVPWEGRIPKPANGFLSLPTSEMTLYSQAQNELVVLKMSLYFV